MSAPAPFPLREAHAHLAALGESLTIPSLALCTSVEECLQRVRTEAAARTSARTQAPAERWIRLMSARVEGWSEPRWPTIAELDAATGGPNGPPCVIKSFDHHRAVANSAALRAAGLRPGMRLPPHGEVEADEHGHATGMLIEQAAWAAWSATPAFTEQQREEVLRAALEHLRALGYVEVHDMLSPPWLGPLLRRLQDRDELRLDVWLYAPYDEAANFVDRGRWETSRVRLAGLKAFADGTLNSRTALMTVPYAAHPGDAYPPDWCGQAMLTPAQLDDALDAASRLRVGLAVHAIGDGAVRMVLDRWEARGGGSTARRDAPALRIEHAELIDERDIPRFANLGVVCSAQPCHLLCDIEVLTRRLPHRFDRVLPFRELINAGCRPGELLWFGSDVPIVSADPHDSITAATLRRRTGMPESQAIGLSQRLTETEAWAGFACAARQR